MSQKPPQQSSDTEKLRSIVSPAEYATGRPIGVHWCHKSTGAKPTPVRARDANVLAEKQRNCFRFVVHKEKTEHHEENTIKKNNSEG